RSSVTVRTPSPASATIAFSSWPHVWISTSPAADTLARLSLSSCVTVTTRVPTSSSMPQPPLEDQGSISAPSRSRVRSGSGPSLLLLDLTPYDVLLAVVRRSPAIGDRVHEQQAVAADLGSPGFLLDRAARTLVEHLDAYIAVVFDDDDPGR